MINGKDSGDLFLKALSNTVKLAIDQIVREETEAAMQRVKERMAAKADELALSLLSEYDIQRETNRLIITVRKTKPFIPGVTL